MIKRNYRIDIIFKSILRGIRYLFKRLFKVKVKRSTEFKRSFIKYKSNYEYYFQSKNLIHKKFISYAQWYNQLLCKSLVLNIKNDLQTYSQLFVKVINKYLWICLREIILKKYPDLSEDVVNESVEYVFGKKSR